MNEVKARVSDGGRIVIPAEFRNHLGIKEGDVVKIRMENGEVLVSPARKSLHRAREITARYVSGDRSLANELIQERRGESDE